MTYSEAHKRIQNMIATQKWLSDFCSTTNPTTALSQLYVAQLYNGKVVNAKGYDVVSEDGKKIQVKARWWKNRVAGPSGSWIAGTENEADLFVFVGFDKDYNVIYCLEFNASKMESYASLLDKRKPNLRTLRISKTLIQNHAPVV